MIKIILIILLLCSCTHSFKKGSDPVGRYFIISNRDSQKQFNNLQEIDLIHFQLSNADIYVSSFAGLDEAYVTPAIDKKKKAFLNLFQDDIIPYTGLEKNRSKCLVKVSDTQVDFLTGPDNQWAECALISPKKALAARLWKACGKYLWQITIKSSEIADFKFQCE